MNDFNTRFQQSQRRFDIMFRVVSTLIAVVFVCIVLFWIGMGVLAVKTVDSVGENGVRGVVEQLWCGKNQDCKLPL